jgi:DNA-binding beta-propeller fold protein YncE
VQEFSPAGAFLAAFGSGGSGNGQFAGPRGVAVNSSGTLYVADSGNNRIEEWVGK